ncbi:MAG: hypothetical protein QY312_00860 [Candidatus Dojkabacteria bacterium]|nr:MAG: hypothetical protein QY312_00860 [Candidatus Dojkabacteria bacterium]
MNTKLFFLKIAIGLLILWSTLYLLGGFVLSRSFGYVTIFILLYLATDFLSQKVRIFFLLPKFLVIQILLHSLLLFGLFLLSDGVIAGVTITQLHPGVVLQLRDTPLMKVLAEFGTIGVVSLFMGTVTQVINWLQSEK